jgi:hypothetical protein
LVRAAGEEGAVVGLTAAAVEAGAERAWDLTRLIAADRQLAGTERARRPDREGRAAEAFSESAEV